MTTTHRRALLGAVAVVLGGCLRHGDGDDSGRNDDGGPDDQRAGDDGETAPETDADRGADPAGGNSDGTILVSGTVFTDDLGEFVDAVPTDDDRFDGSEPWQSAFETIERLVREDDPVLDEPDRTATLAVVERGTDRADTVIETHEMLPVSRPTGYPDGRYVEHVVDGEPTYAAIRLLYPEAD